MQINSLLQNYEIPTRQKTRTKRSSERSECIEAIYAVYTSESERVGRKRENWHRYITYLREQRESDTIPAQARFKRSRSFVKEQEIKSFCYFLSHIPTKDLYYIRSVMQDKLTRGELCSGWLFGTIKN